MQSYVLIHVSDAALVRDLVTLVAQDRRTTATLLAHIAEVDARRLYAPLGYPSMHAYCVEELRLSEDAALKRIQAARAARRFPILFEMVADGRLHLSGICLLAPYLTLDNAEDLLGEAAGRKKSEIEAMLALRFPVLGLTPSSIRPAMAAPRGPAEHAPGHVELGDVPDTRASAETGLALEGDADEHAPGHVDSLTPQCYVIQVTVDAGTREKLRHAQALLSHSVPSGDVAQVLSRALDALIKTLEKRKVGVGAKPSGPSSARHIPASVRREVWERDGGQCTFVSATGRKCGSRRFLEFGHIDPVARGGEATADRMRLRCRAHNQLEAERVFGKEFMQAKREAERCEDVLAGLRRLGFRAHEARRAAEHTKVSEGASLEGHLKAAIQFLGRSKV